MSVSEFIFMSKDLGYFKDFLANPESYNIRDFYSIICEWAEYTIAHKDEFNYLEDEEWREIRERVLHALEIKEDLKEEFEDLESKLDLVKNLTADAEKISVYKEWLEFMKKYQFEYDFTDEVIKESERRLNIFINAVVNFEFKEKELKESDIKLQKALEKLDNSIFANYERTGKRPILTSLKSKKGTKGN